MTDMAQIWPPYGVAVTDGDLRLSVVTDDDIPGLVDLARSGIHAPGEMPFSMPWTDDDPAELPANNVRYYSSVRAGFTAEYFTLLFAVRWRGQLVGIQGFHTEDFALTRTAGTGSWLGLRHQGQGIGTRMRQAVCAFAFDELDAVQVTSGAFVDNPASLAVSRKVGYRPNGVLRLKRRAGEVALNQRLVLSRDDLVRSGPIAVVGAEALRTFLGIQERRG